MAIEVTEQTHPRWDPGEQRTRHARHTRYSPTMDAFRRYLTDNPRPDTFATLMRAVDEGDIAALIEVGQEIEGKDLYIQDLADRRREAVTALDWEVVPDTETQEEKQATEAAEYCGRILRDLPTWPDTLKHLSTAIGPNVAVSELIWHRGQLVETVDVLGDRLVSIPHESQAIRITTDEHMVDGIKTYSPGFIVHIPNRLAGHPFRVTLTRATIWHWCVKHYALADWAAFSEVFGTPTPYANCDPTVSSADRVVVDDMLQNRAGASYGVFPEGVKLALLQASTTNAPYEIFMDWIDRQFAIGWLGQTLTTEPGKVGALSLGRVHENVRASITLADIQNERNTIREQVLRPMVNLRWPRKGYPVPHWQREVVEDQDIENRTLRLQELQFAKDYGLKMEIPWLHEELRIPLPKKTEESETE